MTGLGPVEMAMNGRCECGYRFHVAEYFILSQILVKIFPQTYYIMKNTTDCIKTYALSGGGTVRVCKPFSTQHYSALVEQNGRYPEVGKIARNKGRREFSLVIEGTFTYTVNGTVQTLGANEQILVKDGDRYTIDGCGKVLVVVEDQPEGCTLIEAE